MRSQKAHHARRQQATRRAEPCCRFEVHGDFDPARVPFESIADYVDPRPVKLIRSAVTDADLDADPEPRARHEWSLVPLAYRCLPGWWGLLRMGVQVYEFATLDEAHAAYLQVAYEGRSLADVVGYDAWLPDEDFLRDAFVGHPATEGGE